MVSAEGMSAHMGRFTCSTVTSQHHWTFCPVPLFYVNVTFWDIALFSVVVLVSDVRGFTDDKGHLNSGLDSKREYIGSAFVGRHLHLHLQLPAGICICQGPLACAEGPAVAPKIRCRNLVHALGSRCGHIRGAPPPFAEVSMQVCAS